MKSTRKPGGRLRDAVEEVVARMNDLKARLHSTPGARYAAILDAHVAMLTDERLFDEIAGRIRGERCNGEHAVARVLAEYARTLESVDDAYLSQRAGERVNEHVAWLFTPAHPAILRLVKNVVDTAGLAKIPVSVCGEMSSDPLFTAFLVGLGIDQLILAPRPIPRIKLIIRSISSLQATETAEKALGFTNARDVSAFPVKKLLEVARLPAF